MTTTFPIAITIVAVLLLGSCAISAWGSRKFAWLTSVLSTAMVTGAAISSGVLLLGQWNQVANEYVFEWFQAGHQTIGWIISLNTATLVLTFTVTAISALIHIYSLGYMADDAGERRYFAFLALFTFAMVGLSLSGNLLQMFACWELVGASSYFLIGHWRQRPAAAAAATKAFITNRVGDLGFLAGLGLLWAQAGTLDISALEASGIPTSTAIGLCIFLGVCGKSAQLPLSAWLPDAMEGPTPVSALIHAATMVAAGVFLLVRLHFLFDDIALITIATVGALTALYGGWFALRQHDLKKILAYSTLSQLGLMVMVFGAGSWAATYLHLFTHAFFKAALFLCAGAIIHSLEHTHQGNPQDVRSMGGLKSKMPITYFTFLSASAGLVGIPFFSGFLSKEAMLDSILQRVSLGDPLGYIWLAVFFAVSFLTATYMYRLIRTVFHGQFRGGDVDKLGSVPPIMLAPILVLAFASIWWVVSLHPLHYHGWLLKGLSVPDYEISIGLLTGSVFWLALALYVAHRTYSVPERTAPMMWLDTTLYPKLTRMIQVLGHQSNTIDKRWIDRMLHGIAYIHVSLAFLLAWIDRQIVDGFVLILTRISVFVGQSFRQLGKGSIQGYLQWAVLGLVIFLIWLLN